VDGRKVVVVNAWPDRSNTTRSQIALHTEAGDRSLSLSIRTIDTIVSTKELKARRRSAKVLIPWSELVKYATVQETKDGLDNPKVR